MQRNHRVAAWPESKQRVIVAAWCYLIHPMMRRFSSRRAGATHSGTGDALRPHVSRSPLLRLSRTSPIALLALVASTVALADLATKQLAEDLLGFTDTVPLPLLGPAVRLLVVLNDQAAFGISLGPLTWEINFVLTAVALCLTMFLCRSLSSIDRWAPVMLGLVAGAATGNLASLILSPGGVPDFIAVRGSNGDIVFNLADMAAVAGLIMLGRTLWLVGRAIRSEGRKRA